MKTKRSRRIALTLMAAGSAVALSGCGSSQEEAVSVSLYKSAEECTLAGVFTAEFCNESYEQARQSHISAAPRFSERELCEQQFGADRCQPQQGSDGSSFWMPFFAGYMMSSLLNNASAGNVSDPRRGVPVYYSTTSGAWNTPTGQTLRTDQSGRFSAPASTVRQAPPPARVQTRTTTVSRQGFGGGARGSFGG